MDTAAAIRRQFGAAASRYAESSYHRSSPDLDALLAAAAPRAGERALDLGTGTGHTAIALAPHVGEVLGVDLTPEMLERARAGAGGAGVDNARFETGDAMALDLPNASFDLVVCRQCAHHFERPRKAVREVVRLLRPGGRFVLVDSVAPETAAQDTFLNAVELLRDPSHVRDWSVREWCGMLADAGLAAEALEHWGVWLEFGGWVERSATPETQREALRALFGGATEAVREALGIRTGPEWGFSIPVALIRGTLPG